MSSVVGVKLREMKGIFLKDHVCDYITWQESFP